MIINTHITAGQIKLTENIQKIKKNLFRSLPNVIFYKVF